MTIGNISEREIEISVSGLVANSSYNHFPCHPPEEEIEARMEDYKSLYERWKYKRD